MENVPKVDIPNCIKALDVKLSEVPLIPNCKEEKVSREKRNKKK